MKELITICIVNYNSSDFILNTLYCLEKITRNNYKVIIRDNNSKLKDFLRLQKKIRNYSNITLYRVNNFNFKGSLAHGIALNDLFNKIDTRYGVILDADCTFLFKNWDEILIKEINEEYPIIGTQASGALDSKKHQDFPLTFAILFYTDIMKKLQIDFTPKSTKNNKDTGYELREKYLTNGYKGKLISDKNTRYYKLGPFRKLICAEYYLDGYEKIFASHFGRGSSLGKYKYIYKNNMKKRKIYILPFIGSILLNLKGKSEKRKWIKKCKQIVNEFDKM